MKKKIGRPRAIIDWDKVDKFLIAGCSGVEIAGYFGIHYDVLYKYCRIEKEMNFSSYLTSKKAKGNSLLRAKQYEIAMSGDKTMLVWLGKNRLEQSDKIEKKLSGELTQKSILELPDNGNRAIKVIDE